MIWLQRFTEPIVVAMNKGCHCFSTALTKLRESKGCLKFVLQLIYCSLKVKKTKKDKPTYRLVKWPDPEYHHCAPFTTKYLVKVHNIL